MVLGAHDVFNKCSLRSSVNAHKLTSFLLEIFWDTALAGVAQWIECRLQTKGLPVQFPVRAHAWVVGQVPSGGHMRGNHTCFSPSLSPFLSLSLKINKF